MYIQNPDDGNVLLFLWLGSGDDWEGGGDESNACVSMHSRGRTPVGRAVLRSYLGYVPQLPALLLSHLGSGIEVFLYPPEAPLVSDTVLQWLDRIERQEEQPTGKCCQVHFLEVHIMHSMRLKAHF